MDQPVRTFTHGPMTIIATDEQHEWFGRIPRKTRILMGHIVDPFEVVLVNRATQLPDYVPGKKAIAVWREFRRRIKMADDLKEYDADPVVAVAKFQKVLAHEVCHVLDDDHFTKFIRREIGRLMIERPDSWHDETVADKLVGYAARPSEVFAVYGSAAIYDFDSPVFKKVYKRKINSVDWDLLRAVSLAT